MCIFRGPLYIILKVWSALFLGWRKYVLKLGIFYAWIVVGVVNLYINSFLHYFKNSVGG